MVSLALSLRVLFLATVFNIKLLHYNFQIFYDFCFLLVCFAIHCCYIFTQICGRSLLCPQCIFLYFVVDFLMKTTNKESKYYFYCWKHDKIYKMSRENNCELHWCITSVEYVRGSVRGRRSAPVWWCDILYSSHSISEEGQQYGIHTERVGPQHTLCISLPPFKDLWIAAP